MSDPREPFSAGERLSPARREPPRQPPRQPPQGPGNGKKPRKTGLLRRVAGFFVFGLFRLVFVGIIAAIIGGIAGYFVFSANLPSVTRSSIITRLWKRGLRE